MKEITGLDSVHASVVGPSPLAGPVPGRRRRYSVAQKSAFLAEARQPGQSMSSVGRRYDLSVSLLFRWRRALDQGASPRPERQEGISLQLQELRNRVRELERLLGKKVLENELLRERLSGSAAVVSMLPSSELARAGSLREGNG